MLDLNIDLLTLVLVFMSVISIDSDALLICAENG